MKLENKVAVITGGGSGMGAAVAQLFATEGARVVVADIDENAATAIAKGIGSSASPVALDVTNEQDVTKAIGLTVAEFGRIDVLVNCAGMADFRKTEETTLERWRRIVDVNLTGTFLCCREAGGRMVAAGAGSIVNVASTSGLAASPYMAAYSAAKHGVVGLTKALAIEWGKHHVRVNCVCPGATETAMLLGTTTEAYRSERRRRVPLGRLGLPTEQASAILFLASADSAYVTGAALTVDGGIFAMSPATSEGALAGD